MAIKFRGNEHDLPEIVHENGIFLAQTNSREFASQLMNCHENLHLFCENGKRYFRFILR
jgi:hypothetical protein